MPAARRAGHRAYPAPPLTAPSAGARDDRSRRPTASPTRSCCGPGRSRVSVASISFLGSARISWCDGSRMTPRHPRLAWPTKTVPGMPVTGHSALAAGWARKSLRDIQNRPFRHPIDEQLGLAIQQDRSAGPCPSRNRSARPAASRPRSRRERPAAREGLANQVGVNDRRPIRPGVCLAAGCRHRRALLAERRVVGEHRVEGAGRHAGEQSGRPETSRCPRS